MRIEYLEEFVELARFLSFTEAASRLNMSQPTLSKHINSLERELKVPLFSRNGASLSLTKAGKLVLPLAFSIIESRKQMSIAAKQGASMLTPHLTIGGNVGLKTVLERVSLVASRFTERYGVDIIEISDIEANPHDSIDMSSDSAPDFLFLYIDETDEIEQDAEVRFIARVPLSIVVNKRHRLAHGSVHQARRQFRKWFVALHRGGLPDSRLLSELPARVLLPYHRLPQSDVRVAPGSARAHQRLRPAIPFLHRQRLRYRAHRRRQGVHAARCHLQHDERQPAYR